MAVCDCGELSTPCSYYSLTFGGENNSKKADDDDLDLFGEQTEEEKGAAKKLAEKLAESKKKKPAVIAKSTLVIDVKPHDIDTDLEALHKLVKDIKMEGLSWGEAYKIEPIAFGLHKLQVGCTIIDDLVNTEDLIDKIAALGMDNKVAAALKKRREREVEDYDEEEPSGLVQSADIVSFQKL